MMAETQGAQFGEQRHRLERRQQNQGLARRQARYCLIDHRARGFSPGKNRTNIQGLGFRRNAPLALVGFADLMT